MRMLRGTSPVQKGNIIEISISGMNHQGEGVGRYEGFTIFVPFALPEERVAVQIEEVKRSYARGRILEYLSSSSYRNESQCSAFGVCGGCHLLHYDYHRQLVFKQDIVKNALHRIGKLKGVQVLPTIGMKNPYAYRNKAEYPVDVIEGLYKSGFFASKSSRLVALEGDCQIQHPLLERIRKAFMDICNEPDFREAFVEAGFHQLVIRAGVNSGEVMVVPVFEKPLRVSEGAAKRFVDMVPEVVSFYQKISKPKGKGKSKAKYELIAGKASIREKIGDLKFDISPGSFFQVNSAQAEVLFSKTVEYADCKGICVDAYCGTGSISLFLAQKAAKVYGFEVYPDAVKDARHNAEINGIDNVEFAEGDVADTIEDLGIKPETIVIDPPRAGCEERVLNSITDLQPEKIVYVSCNPATLARDLKILADKDYSVKKVQPIDMFPQTYHVETVCLLTRK